MKGRIRFHQAGKSFGKPITALEDLESALATYTAGLAEKLRAGKLLAARLQVFLTTNPFQPNQPQYTPSAYTTLEEPTNHTPTLISAAVGLLRQIYRPGYQYKKTGVVLTDLGSEAGAQLALFSGPGSDPKRAALDEAVDLLNKRLGRNTVKYGAMGTDPKWGMRQTRKSRNFTTRWADLPVASA